MASTYFALKILRRRKLTRQKDKPYDIPETDRCRICLSNEGKIPIFKNEGKLDLAEYIRIITNVEVSSSDIYPKFLCNNCFACLQDAIKFRKLAKESDKLLRSNGNVEFYTETENLCQEISFEAGISQQDCNGTDKTTQEVFSETNASPFHSKGTYSEAENYREIKENAIVKYNCKPCKLKSKTSSRHNIRIQCRICWKIFTLRQYKNHRAIHQSPSCLMCEFCGKMCQQKGNLLRHLQLHSNNLPSKCPQCPYRGRSNEALRLHMRIHTGEKPFSCHKCQSRFVHRSNLTKHLRTHLKDKPFKCEECGKGFYNERDLGMHHKSSHLGIREVCRECGNNFSTRKQLLKHELRIHKRDKMVQGKTPLYLRPEFRKDSNSSY